MGAERDALASAVEDLDPEEWLWLPGIDYAAGWRAAKAEAVELNALLAKTGLERGQLRAVPDTDAAGGGIVRLIGTPDGWRQLELLLALARQQ
ncbi:hypothetical protein ABT095_17385 [Kitasatospora sp. NPDC002227]|uniref:hypothetical protein n=1 Tax=Kitasatospora sp. NPDC002227 TaxID=3154773 RepID=UPI00331B7779